MGKLTKNDFDVADYENQLNYLSLIGKYKIPKNHVYLLESMKKMRVYLPVTETRSPGTGSSRTELTISTNMPIADAEERTKDQEIYAEWNGSSTEVVSVDYDNNTITIAVDDTDATAQVWYLPANGSVSIQAKAPSGLAQSLSKEIYGNQLSLVHQVDQIQGNTVTPNDEFALPQDFFIELKANVSEDMDVSKVNGIIQIPYTKDTVNEFTQKLLTSPNLTEQERMMLETGEVSLSEVVIRSWTETA